jgi:serine O-acetyltransferase
MSKAAVIQKIKKIQPQINFQLKSMVEDFTESLFKCLFDKSIDLDVELTDLEKRFKVLADIVCWDEAKNCSKIWDDYLETLPAVLEKLMLDAKALDENDPASASLEEVFLAYPGFYAIAVYRLSKELHKKGFPLVPRLMTEYAHQITGVDIHPGAEIGHSFFIDHATGIVIGETTVIKNNVRLYQGVTLGALYVSKNIKNTKRHPTVEDNVTIYANATILGGATVIGANSVIGGNVWLTQSVAPNSLVYHTTEIKIKTVSSKV